jgi:hypothetical protein
MIVKKRWIKVIENNKDLGYRMDKKVYYEGLFLFGLIPLWIEQTKVEYL